MSNPITKDAMRASLDRIRAQLEAARRQLDDLVEVYAEKLGDAEFGPEGNPDEVRARSDEADALREAAERLASADDEIEQATALVGY
jgi:ubiquinone biosynthesis protein UbiJ